MKQSDALKLLTYIAAWDNRTVSKEKAAVWADGLPDWLTLGLAMESTKRFFTQPKEGEGGRYFTSRDLILMARESLQAEREIQQHRALDATMDRLEALPPAQGRRKEIVQGGLAGLLSTALRKVDES